MATDPAGSSPSVDPDGPPPVPIHPECVPGDERTLRWLFPAGTLTFVGTPNRLPNSIQHLLDDHVIELLTVEPASLLTTLAAGLTWRGQGPRVRSALQEAFADPHHWQPPTRTSGDDQLRMAAQQVIEGEVGNYIRSHGGGVEVLTVRDNTVEVRLSGACNHCPASDITLTQRLETGIRDLYPALSAITTGPGNEPHRRPLLRLLPTRRA